MIYKKTGNKAMSIHPYLVAITLATFSQGLLAHSTPSDFAEMSLKQLFSMTIDERASDAKTNRWRISYQFNKQTLGGYRDGTREIADTEVLWLGPGNPRTNENFPVLPTNIKQQVQIFRASYQYDNTTQLSVTVPWIRQSTDHISIVPGYNTFLITSKGLGDIKLDASQSFYTKHAGRVLVTAGISLPTGSIDEEGDTPRAAGDQQLPYTMQLGSGTWDFSTGLTYSSKNNKWNSGVNAVIRSSKNDRDYRLGNHYSASTTFRFDALGIVAPYVGMEGRYLSKITGQDDAITVPTAFPYPASITNPNLYGGTSVNILTGAEVNLGINTWRLDLGYPVYQRLNGPQPQYKWKFSLNYSLAL
ncbi:MAG: hypothetical protein ACJAVI_001151 [Candidatus Azotimanducaceae bacterium]|jgi:hypothetical protein